MNTGACLATSVRVAGTSNSRRKGLLGLDRLQPGEGLWINPSEAIHTFGMKIPIDAIFLNRHLKVRKLRANLVPRRIALCVTASSVLEVGAGTIAASGIEVGDTLEFRPVCV